MILSYEQVGVEVALEIAEASADEFSRFMNVNVTGSFRIVQHASALMKAQEPRPYSKASPGRGSTRGSIVLMGSAASLVVQPRMVQYTTSKHAVLGLARTAGTSGPFYFYFFLLLFLRWASRRNRPFGCHDICQGS